MLSFSKLKIFLPNQYRLVLYHRKGEVAFGCLASNSTVTLSKYLPETAISTLECGMGQVQNRICDQIWSQMFREYQPTLRRKMVSELRPKVVIWSQRAL